MVRVGTESGGRDEADVAVYYRSNDRLVGHVKGSRL